MYAGNKTALRLALGRAYFGLLPGNDVPLIRPEQHSHQACEKDINHRGHEGTRSFKILFLVAFVIFVVKIPK
jgi:hypothetical protein